MLADAAFGIALVATLLTLSEASRAYPRLPERMPLHFGLRGQPGSYGPKLVFVVIFGAISIGLCANLATMIFAVAPNTGVDQTRAIVTVSAALVFVAYIQHAIIDAVTRHGSRLSMTTLWIAVALLLGIAGVAEI